MTQLMLGAAAVLLVLFGVRVSRMPRSLPFAVAYAVFVIVVVGGGLAVFLGASWAAVLLGLSKEAALAATLAATVISLFFLWWVAKRAIR
jgi:hypothetical protein